MLCLRCGLVLVFRIRFFEIREVRLKRLYIMWFEFIWDVNKIKCLEVE